MNGNLAKLLVVLSLLFILQAGFVMADELTNFDLSLHENSQTEERIVPIPKLGEFKLSLGSQILEQNDDFDASDLPPSSKLELVEAVTDIPSFVLHTPKAPDFSEQELRLKSEGFNQRAEPRITLTTDYTSNSIGAHDPAIEKLSIGRETHKLALYGEFEQERVHFFSATNQSRRSTDNLNMPRASVMAPDGQLRPDSQARASALSSHYYLEAVYSFMPTVTGRFSYKKATIDAQDSEEKLQVEGVVEANRNVLIKAGFNNEIRPELNEPKTTKDTKVWTEFILKF